MIGNRGQDPGRFSPEMAFDIVAFGCSAGGLTALSEIFAQLPSDFPVPLVVVQHLDPHHPSLMVQILGRRTPVHVLEAKQGEALTAHCIYLAPPDHHLLINPDHTISLTHTELVHFVRPSADLLFESVAASYKERAIAVVLTGTGSDGAMGVQAIKKMGGKVIVQSEDSAEFPGMPQAAIHTQSVDYILPLEEIARVIVTLVKRKGMP
jgi:two-component system chemotaxis response regulator CheB